MTEREAREAWLRMPREHDAGPPVWTKVDTAVVAVLVSVFLLVVEVLR